MHKGKNGGKGKSANAGQGSGATNGKGHDKGKGHEKGKGHLNGKANGGWGTAEEPESGGLGVETGTTEGGTTGDGLGIDTSLVGLF